MTTPLHWDALFGAVGTERWSQLMMHLAVIHCEHRRLKDCLYQLLLRGWLRESSLRHLVSLIHPLIRVCVAKVIEAKFLTLWILRHMWFLLACVSIRVLWQYKFWLVTADNWTHLIVMLLTLLFVLLNRLFLCWKSVLRRAIIHLSPRAIVFLRLAKEAIIIRLLLRVYAHALHLSQVTLHCQVACWPTIEQRLFITRHRAYYLFNVIILR